MTTKSPGLGLPLPSTSSSVLVSCYWQACLDMMLGRGLSQHHGSFQPYAWSSLSWPSSNLRVIRSSTSHIRRKRNSTKSPMYSMERHERPFHHIASYLNAYVEWPFWVGVWAPKRRKNPRPPSQKLQVSRQKFASVPFSTRFGRGNPKEHHRRDDRIVSPSKRLCQVGATGLMPFRVSLGCKPRTCPREPGRPP